MYMNFWYPVARSGEITAETPLAVRILSLPFVAYRDSKGQAHVLADTCVHRGGSLSKGKIKGDCISCPYHGWEFAGDGKCQRVPSISPGKPPPRAKVDSYPVQEKYGLVFAFLGDLPEAERPPVYDIEEFNDPAWKCQTYVLELGAYYERSMENGLDPIHNEFVHPLQGAPKLSDELQREPLPVETIPWGTKFFLPFGDKLDRNTALQALKSGKPVSAAGSWHQGPNQLVTWIQLTEHNAFHQYLFEQPVDDSHTRIYFINLRNWLMEDKHDARVEEITLKIVHEDMAVIQNLNPVRSPRTNNKEILLPGDQAVLRYRECLKDWEGRGWRLDMKSLKAEAGDVAFAIPSPARRESGNWVLDPVPTVPASGGKRATASG
jgi:phenylpropionate dioxygenase-like ring-hydroxylating dioxygenase large terminal subunit